jgi:hypothetical protein
VLRVNGARVRGYLGGQSVAEPRRRNAEHKDSYRSRTASVRWVTCCVDSARTGSRATRPASTPSNSWIPERTAPVQRDCELVDPAGVQVLQDGCAAPAMRTSRSPATCRAWSSAGSMPSLTKWKVVRPVAAWGHASGGSRRRPACGTASPAAKPAHRGRTCACPSRWRRCALIGNTVRISIPSPRGRLPGPDPSWLALPSSPGCHVIRIPPSSIAPKLMGTCPRSGSVPDQI